MATKDMKSLVAAAIYYVLIDW